MGTSAASPSNKPRLPPSKKLRLSKDHHPTTGRGAIGSLSSNDGGSSCKALFCSSSRVIPLGVGDIMRLTPKVGCAKETVLVLVLLENLVRLVLFLQRFCSI